MDLIPSIPATAPSRISVIWLSTTGAEAERTAAQVAARTHPDLAVLATDRVVITIEEVRQLVAQSQFSPSIAPYRVIIIEDADRMTERTSNVLLKALEEPPPRTVWVLCAPSAADLIPTIRSRVRVVRLRVPSVAEVAELRVRRDGIEPAPAELETMASAPALHGVLPVVLRIMAGVADLKVPLLAEVGFGPNWEQAH